MPSAGNITPDGMGTLVTPQGNQFNIQGGQRSGDGVTLLHSFRQFGLNANQTANFITPATIQNILGRVVGGDASVINGLLQVTGSQANLYLINPAGILFGPNARLNIPASFTATTANGIGFSHGGWWSAIGPDSPQTLFGPPQSFAFLTSQPGAIFNAGHLTVGAGQSLTLLGGTVVNTGTITAPGGTITIAAVPGEKLIRLSQPGTLLSLELPTIGMTGLASGAIATPKSLPQLLTGGELGNATGVTVEQGMVKLTGSGSVIATTPGNATVTGQLSVAASIVPRGIFVLGANIALFGATLNASGGNGGGTVLIGGDTHGQGTIPQAQSTFVDRQTLINANALTSGNGGKVIVWADQATTFAGTITAQGAAMPPDGARSNGGFVEVSGQQHLTYRGQVDTTAPQGAIGTLLLDPVDILIQNGVGDGAADGITTFQGSSTPGQVVATDTGPSILFESELAGLARTTNIFIEASNTITIAPLADRELLFNSGIGAGTIAFKAGGSFSMDVADTIHAAGRSVTITAANLTVGNIDTREGGGGGDIRLEATNGNITAGSLWASAFTVITSAGNGGQITVNATGNISMGDLSTYSWSRLPGNLLPANAGNAGNVAVTSQSGNISVGEVNAYSKVGDPSDSLPLRGLGNSRAGGNVTLQAPNGRVTAQDIFTASVTVANQGSALTGGNVDITGSTGINIAGNGIQTDSTALGTGDTSKAGNISLNSNSNILVNTALLANSVAAIGNADKAGNISIIAGGNIILPTVAASSQALNGSTKNGGNITVNANGNIVVQSLNATAGNTGSGGNIDITTPQFFQAVNSFIDPILDTSVSLSTTGQAADGTITIRHGGGLINTPFNIGASSPNGTIAAIATNADTLSVLSIPGNFTQGKITILTPTPVNPPVPPLPGPDDSAFPPALPPDAILANQILANPLPFVPPKLTASQAQAALKAFKARVPPSATPFNGPMLNLDPLVAKLESTFTQKFRAETGALLPAPPKSLDQAKETLSNIAAATGVKPALIYISFIPEFINSQENADQTGDRDLSIRPQDSDVLELVLVPATGHPIRHRVPEAFRERVMAAAREMQEQVTDPKLTQTTGYLRSAQFLYHWMIKPLVPDLEARHINNLTFILDNGLRTIPLAALHDGQAFLVERYSIGLMPSLSLTNTQLGHIKSTQVLAAGTSQFRDRAALPIVPLELATITQKLWHGKVLLDQDFTLANLKAQRQQTPFGIIHLATHSEFLPGNINQSNIQLWQSELRLDQLDQLGWDNPPVELVVLSACRTALGNSSAELGFAGFTVRSGVKSVLASLWNVSDDGTTGLMSEFYQQLQKAPIKTEALRQAQLALLHGQVYLHNHTLHWSSGAIALPPDASVAGDRPFSHPYYWAAFTMVGNPW